MNSDFPQKVKITKIEDQSPTVKLFRLELEKKIEKNEDGTTYNPGQFILIGQVGYGESPFGPLSSPYENKYFEVAVRKAGIVTNYLHSLKKGDEITLRGPYGNGFPMDFFKGKDIVLITGGCGIPPIAALLEYVIKNKKDFGRVYLIYGAKTPDEILLKNKVEKWKKDGIHVIITIDKPIEGWDGPVGYVSDFVKEIKIDEEIGRASCRERV